MLFTLSIIMTSYRTFADGRRFGGVPINTNSLAFRDSEVRYVLKVAQSRRILLIGDSFTEGVGTEFENTFAGLLQRAGQSRAEKVEFLNAAVSSYSPTLYYRKIKFLLDSGVTFDEVVVFSDISDVYDEGQIISASMTTRITPSTASISQSLRRQPHCAVWHLPIWRGAKSSRSRTKYGALSRTVTGDTLASRSTRWSIAPTPNGPFRAPMSAMLMRRLALKAASTARSARCRRSPIC